MPTHSRVVTREELIARREEILRDLKMTLEEFEAFAEKHKLAGDEWQYRSELVGIAIMLGEA